MLNISSVSDEGPQGFHENMESKTAGSSSSLTNAPLLRHLAEPISVPMLLNQRRSPPNQVLDQLWNSVQHRELSARAEPLGELQSGLTLLYI